MKKIWFLAFLIGLLSVVSCRTDLNFEPLSHELTFSQDTVYLDPVFSETQSSSYLLKIYNRSNKNVQIPQLKLAKGEQSFFNLLVNGRSAKEFNHIELLAKDSLYVFIHTLGKAQGLETDFLYTDQLRIQGSSVQQAVELVTLIKDAHFLHPGQAKQEGVLHTIQLNTDTTIEGFYLGDSKIHVSNTLKMTNNKPYVIYGYAFIPENKTLTIEKGTQLYFHENSGILGLKGSAIHAEGTVDEPITMRNDRFEADYQYLAGQWSGIHLQEPKASVLDHVIIENAKIGLYLERASDMLLKNVQLYNHSYSALLAINSKVKGQNMVAAHTQNATVVLRDGGAYQFQHCTFINTGFRPNQTALLVEQTTDTPFESLVIQNSLLHTALAQSFVLNTTDTAPISFQYNALKDTSMRNTASAIYNYNNEALYFNNMILTTPSLAAIDFKNPKQNAFYYSEKMTHLIQKGNLNLAKNIPQDLLGKDRTHSADLGAYQHIETTKE